ncbi:WAT1-related protein [Dichanthelium oligosanthes]|uniref:WAT1-related protein n=1 Tax=Dichanthelium oligosanthes TaxID=888268 RepID=A0A1E5V012_9POAL|nr:WAT1-related protein [Dichanthelium oligosanthes]
MDAKKPYVIAIIVQLIYTGMFVVSKAAFDHGMNTYVFIFYRQAAASLLLLPIALLLERITFSLNLYNVSLKFTSATVASATTNAMPVVTFCFALLLKMEVVKLRSSSGIAKLAGVSVCLAGVFVIAFYVGPALSPVTHHRAFAAPHASASAGSAPSRMTWIKGTFLMVLANMAWSLWIVLQGKLLKEYPNKMLVTVTQCVFSTVQSFGVAVVAERDFSKWNLRLDISLLAVLYTGFVVTGVTYYLQAWCVEMKGPVFFAVWTPLCFVFTIFCSSFFLGEIVHLGSVLWGKSKEAKIAPCSKVNTIDDADDENDHHKPQEDPKSASIVEQV